MREQANTSTLGTLVAALLVSAILVGCEQGRLDKEVRELCAKDGGIKVYETVKLPPEKFDKWGLVTFYDPTRGENALGVDYIFKREIHYYRKGNPSMVRYHHQLLRRSDGKLLGETISYGRGGGDLPGPWEPSNYHCPPTADAGVNALLIKVFRKSQ